MRKGVAKKKIYSNVVSSRIYTGIGCPVSSHGRCESGQESRENVSSSLALQRLYCASMILVVLLLVEVEEQKNEGSYPECRNDDDR